jgi:hypothetical protein
LITNKKFEHEIELKREFESFRGGQTTSVDNYLPRKGSRAPQNAIRVHDAATKQERML